MKIKLLILLFLFTLPELKAQFPEIYLKDLNNKQLLLSEIKGDSVTIVDFWATWCKPCLIAIPELIKIQEEFSSRGVKVIGISIDSPRNSSKIKPFSSARGINYPILLDTDQEMMTELNVILVPTLIVFDTKGKQVYSHEGFNHGDQDEVRQEILKLLKQ